MSYGQAYDPYDSGLQGLLFRVGDLIAVTVGTYGDEFRFIQQVHHFAVPGKVDPHPVLIGRATVQVLPYLLFIVCRAQLLRGVQAFDQLFQLAFYFIVEKSHLT